MINQELHIYTHYTFNLNEPISTKFTGLLPGGNGDTCLHNRLRLYAAATAATACSAFMLTQAIHIYDTTSLFHSSYFVCAALSLLSKTLLPFAVPPLPCC